jgi:hypothetical protein
VVRCPYRTGSCRTFYVEAVLKTAFEVSRQGWPPGHCYTSPDSGGIFLMTTKYSHNYQKQPTSIEISAQIAVGEGVGEECRPVQSNALFVFLIERRRR